jgi:hypothetical protein
LCGVAQPHFCCSFWPGDYNKWFRAEVVSVDNDVEEEGQDGQMHVNPDKFYCLLR